MFTKLGRDALKGMAESETAAESLEDRQKRSKASRRRFYIFSLVVTGWAALVFWQAWTWAGFATTVLGLLLDIIGGAGLAVGVLRVEEQPIGRAIRHHNRWGTCVMWGFATEEGKQKARRAAIFRNGRLVIAGFIFQMLGAVLGFFI